MADQTEVVEVDGEEVEVPSGATPAQIQQIHALMRGTPGFKTRDTPVQDVLPGVTVMQSMDMDKPISIGGVPQPVPAYEARQRALGNADEAANHHADIPQAQAAQNVTHAQELGVSPALPDFLQATKDRTKRNLLQQIFEDSPGVAAWAAQPGHAPTVGYDDAGYVSAWEKWITGPQQFNPQTGQRESVGNGLLMAALIKGVTQWHVALQDEYLGDLGVKLINSINQVDAKGKKPEQVPEGSFSNARTKAELSDAKSLDQEAERQYQTASGGTHPWQAEIVKGLPGMLPMLVVPSAAPALLFTQSYGTLRSEGVDTGLAASGAFMAALVGHYAGQALVSGATPKAAVLMTQSVMAGKMASAFLNPVFQDLTKIGFKHAALGWVTGMGMGLAEESARIADDFSKTGRTPDVSELWDRFEKISVSSLAMVPFGMTGAWGEFNAQRGRRLAAKGDQVNLDAQVKLVDAMKLPKDNPEVAKAMLKFVAQQAKAAEALKAVVPHTDLHAEAIKTAADALGRPVAKPSEPGLPFVYVTPDAIARAAGKLGIHPDELTTRITDGKHSWTDADATKTSIPVPLENYLVDLKDHHETMKDGVSMSKDNPSMEEVNAEEPVTEPTPEEIQYQKNLATRAVIVSGIDRAHQEALDAHAREFHEAQAKQKIVLAAYSEKHALQITANNLHDTMAKALADPTPTNIEILKIAREAYEREAGKTGIEKETPANPVKLTPLVSEQMRTADLQEFEARTRAKYPESFHDKWIKESVERYGRDLNYISSSDLNEALRAERYYETVGANALEKDIIEAENPKYIHSHHKAAIWRRVLDNMRAAEHERMLAELPAKPISKLIPSAEIPAPPPEPVLGPEPVKPTYPAKPVKAESPILQPEPLAPEELQAALTRGGFPNYLREEITRQTAAAQQVPGKMQGKLPDYLLEMMREIGQDPGRIFNDYDLSDLKVQEAIKSDPTLTSTQKEHLLRTGTLKGAPPEPGAHPEPDWKALAQEHVANKTLGDLDTQDYAKSAAKARKAMDKALLQTVNQLAAAFKKAQAGVGNATEAAKSGQSAAVLSDAARRSAKEFPQAFQELNKSDIKEFIDSEFKTAPKDLKEKFAEPLLKAAKEQGAVLAKEAEREQSGTAKQSFAESKRKQRKAEDLSVAGTEKETKAGDAMQAYEEARKLYARNAAIEVARVKTVTEGEKVSAYVKKQTSVDAREDFYRDQAVGNLYDTIMESTGQPKRQHPLDLEDSYTALMQQGAELTFDAEHIASVVDKPHALDEMTLAQAKNVKLALENLRAIAKASSDTYVNGQILKRADVLANDIIPALQAGAKGPSLVESIESKLENTRLGKKFHVSRGNPDAADFTTLWGGLGEWGRSVQARRIYARNVESKLLAEYADPATKLPVEIKKLARQPVAWPADMQAKYGFDLTRADVYKIVGMTGTEEGLTSFAKSWGMPPERLHDWIFKDVGITKPEMDFVDSKWKKNETLGDLVAGTKSNAGGTPMKRQAKREITAPWGEKYTGGYEHFSWIEGKGLTPLDAPDSADTHGLGSDVQHKFTVERVKQGKLGDLPDVRWDNVASHYAETAHYISHNDLVRDAYRMLKEPDFVNAVSATRGDLWYERLKDSYRLLKGDRAPQTSTGLTNLFKSVKSVYAASVFNYNLTLSAGVLGGHIVATMPSIGLDAYDIGLGLAKMASGEGWRFAHETSDVVQARHRDSFQQVNKNVNEIMGTTPSKIDYAQMPGHYLNEAIDTTLARVLFLSSYHKMLPVLGHAEAKMQADLDLEKVMPKRNRIDQSALVRDQTLGLYLMVRNFPNTIWNLNAQDQWETRSQIGRGDTDLFRGYGGLAMRRLGQAAGLGFGVYLMGHGRNEQEQSERGWGGYKGWVQAAGRTLLTEGVYGSILLHEVMRPFAGHFVGEEFNPWSLRMFDSIPGQAIRGAIKDLGKIAQGDSKDKIVGAVDLLGRTMGGNLGRSARGVSEIDWRNDMLEQQVSKALYGAGSDATPLTDLGELRKKIQGNYFKLKGN